MKTPFSFMAVVLGMVLMLTACSEKAGTKALDSIISMQVENQTDIQHEAEMEQETGEDYEAIIRPSEETEHENGLEETGREETDKEEKEVKTEKEIKIDKGTQ